MTQKERQDAALQQVQDALIACLDCDVPKEWVRDLIEYNFEDYDEWTRAAIQQRIDAEKLAAAKENPHATL